MRRCTLCLLLVLGACTPTREERVIRSLEKEGYEDVELERKNSTTYRFTATKNEVECEGTATVAIKGDGYAAKERVSAEARCR